MTDEQKKLIEDIKVVKHYDAFKYVDVVLKSDFDRVVEELTKWNKWGDFTPEPLTPLKFKLDNGFVGFGYYSTEGLLFYDWQSLLYFSEVDVTEWKYI